MGMIVLSVVDVSASTLFTVALACTLSGMAGGFLVALVGFHGVIKRQRERLL